MTLSTFKLICTLVLTLDLWPIDSSRGVVTGFQTHLPSPAVEHYYSRWIEQLEQIVPPEYQGQLMPVIDPSHSQFPYYFLNNDLIFNQYTYDYISSAVLPGPINGTVQLSTSHSFTNRYIQLMSDISYELGPQDTAALKTLATELSRHATELVTTYEATFGIITQEQLLQANKRLESYNHPITTKLDYVVLYQFGYLWSNRQAESQAPLSFVQIATAKSLQTLFPNIPATGALLLPSLAAYLNNYRNILVRQNTLQYNNWALADALQNAQYPNDLNGGIRTFDPLNGDVSGYKAGYGIEISLAEIQNALNDKGRIITLHFSFGPPADKRDTPLGNTLVPDGSFLFTGHTGETITLGNLAVNGKMSMTITYEGYVYIPFSSAAWRSNDSVGWYYNTPIAQATNTLPKQTGYKFTLAPQKNVSRSKKLGLLTGLLVANPPKVEITYEGTFGSESKALNDLPKKGALQFLARPFGTTYTPSLGVKTHIDSNTTSILFTPVTERLDIRQPAKDSASSDISVPVNLRMANVLLASVAFPAHE